VLKHSPLAESKEKTAINKKQNLDISTSKECKMLRKFFFGVNSVWLGLVTEELVPLPVSQFFNPPLIFKAQKSGKSLRASSAFRFRFTGDGPFPEWPAL
jgi:hypothetical protein